MAHVQAHDIIGIPWQIDILGVLTFGLDFKLNIFF